MLGRYVTAEWLYLPVCLYAPVRHVETEWLYVFGRRSGFERLYVLGWRVVVRRLCVLGQLAACGVYLPLRHVVADWLDALVAQEPLDVRPEVVALEQPAKEVVALAAVAMRPEVVAPELLVAWPEVVLPEPLAVQVT